MTTVKRGEPGLVAGVRTLALGALAASALLPAAGNAQSADRLSPEVAKYVSVSAPTVALRHVRVIDGSGAPPLDDHTILIVDGLITGLGPTDRVPVPEGAEVLDLPGHTVIPGLVGLHDHLFYTAEGGRRVQLGFSAPRLYLASGVTTIRTTGSFTPFADIHLKEAIERGESPGPRIHITAPYITGDEGPGYKAQIYSPEQARRFVAYWAGEGATWLKAYTTIRRAELAAAIEEAHRRGLRVTGHLCSVSYREAVELGIDNLEHGLLTASDFASAKEVDRCPSNLMVDVGRNVDPTGPEAQATIGAMVEAGVSMTSTLAVYEPFFPGRPVTDERSLEAMAPEIREAYLSARARIDAATENFPLRVEMLKKAMAFEKAFHDAGGVLAAGVDPTGIGGALPGYGDQRNLELLVEGGFTSVEAVRIATLNGARVLGVEAEVGSIEEGKRADLVVIEGDLAADVSAIRSVTLVFKDGVGFDSRALIESVKGMVGIR